MARRIFLLFSIVIGTYSIPAPQLTACDKNDSVCQRKNANILYHQTVAGIPELNIERQDPMYHENVVGDLGVVKYQLRNTTLEGFKDCDVVDMKLELAKSKLHFNLDCPYFNMYGLYKISGQILTIPIEGDGDFILKFNDYFIKIQTDIKVVQGKDGKRYLSFKSFTVDADLRGGMIADLSNLFNGQKEPADTVLKFINANSKPVATLLQGPSFNANVKKLVKNFNTCLKHIPLDQLIRE